MDLLQKIESNKEIFSKSEMKVCNIILNNPHMVELHTITMLAATANTSTSAVLRFCKTLGYRGYQDFRYDIMQYLHSNDSDKSRKTDNPILLITDIYKKALLSLASLDPGKIQRLARDILDADTIYNLGLYRSSLLAEKLRYNLEDLGHL